MGEHDLLRLELAREWLGEPVWFLEDYVQDANVVNEMQRLLSRFNRVVLSLMRLAEKTKRARNEPYGHVLGVRCKLGHRVIGVYTRVEPKGLEFARTLGSAEWDKEREFHERHARRQSSRPPPAKSTTS